MNHQMESLQIAGEQHSVTMWERVHGQREEEEEEEELIWIQVPAETSFFFQGAA